MLTEKQRKSIKKKMIDCDMTVTALSKVIGISRSYLSSILAGTISNEAIEQKLIEWKRGK